MIKEFDVNSMDAPGNNVFGLSDPEAYGCCLWSYHPSHSRMVLRISKAPSFNTPHEELYLSFEAVDYFEGPIVWKGANFCTSTMEEYVLLLHKVQSSHKVEAGFVHAIDFSSLPRLPGRLFILDTLNLRIKLIAGFASLSNERPVEMQ